MPVRVSGRVVWYRSLTRDRASDLKQKLAHSTEDEIKSLMSSLEATKEQTAADLRRNVFEK